ncbi:MAG: hypothetical protein IH946_04065, partial [Bacteroidetes bacterium]|nr:hypothetical protein [Bacteroidota bacterium]
ITSSPLFINPEFTVAENLTVGISITRHQYKHFLQEDTIDYVVEWPEENNEVVYSNLIVGLKGSYHFTGFLHKMIKLNKKYDIYVSGFAGYNLTSASGTDSTDEFEKEAFRAGISVGGRYLYSDHLGFFLEYGFNSFNSGSFGISLMF